MTTPSDPTRHHLLVQAPVPAVDGDGLGVVILGTIAFGVASVILAMLPGGLTATHYGSWPGVSVSGFLLGLVGIGYCWQRRRRRTRAAADLSPGGPGGRSRQDPR